MEEVNPSVFILFKYGRRAIFCKMLKLGISNLSHPLLVLSDSKASRFLCFKSMSTYLSSKHLGFDIIGILKQKSCQVLFSCEMPLIFIEMLYIFLSTSGDSTFSASKITWWNLNPCGKFFFTQSIFAFNSELLGTQREVMSVSSWKFLSPRLHNTVAKMEAIINVYGCLYK